VFTVCGARSSATIAAFHAPIVLASSSTSGTSPKAGRTRVWTFLRVPYAEAGCWSFHAGHHLVVTYSPNSVRAFSWSRSAGAGSSWGRPRSMARFSASARGLVRKMPAERCRLPSW
jgi:hypothetical protein